MNRHSGTPALLNYFPRTFSAACPGCGRTLLGLLAALSASLPAVFAAVTVVVLVSLFPATVEAQGDPEEPCPGGGYNPTPVAVAVAAVPIVVASTTADYFVLYVRHTVDGSEVEFPVLVKRGEVDTTTLAENVAALPKERYRVEKYLIADPADVDGDCIDDLTELTNLGSQNPVNPAAGIALTDGAVAIPDEETFTALSEVFASRSGGWTHVVKFLLADTDTDRPLVYFMNTSKHLIHQSFIDAVGPELGRHTSGKLTYHPELVAPDGSQGLYYFSLTNLILPAFSHAERSYTQLAASMRLLDDNLAVYIPNRWLSRVQSDLQFFRASRMHLVFDEDLFSETDFQALNPGEGYGRLRALEPDERPHPRDIVLYEALPNELPRVAGIISTVPQTPLSHINLRAVQDRIPNAFIRNALDKTNITSLLDNFVRYEVTETGWELRAATKAEVDAHYESSRPAQSQTPQRDLKVTTIKPLSEVGFADWKAFGVKAANVAVLGMLGFPTGTVPTGFAIPFYFYDEFMKHNDFYTRIDTMLADPDFQSKFDTQEKELRKLRKVIKDADTPAWITTALTTMHATFPEGTSLRYRSSTNNEDLPNFNGAGLYDSKTQHPEETEEDGIDKSLKQVFASLWNFRAFIERDFHRIDHLQAAMGVLVHPSYQDERVNGVAVSFDPIYDRGDLYYVNNQVGEDLVTNPEPHSVPEELLLSLDTGRYIILSFSNLVEPGELLLSDAQVRQLRQHLTVIHDHFKGLYKPALGEPFAMEIEFKITSEKILAIKQARPWVFDGNAADEPAVLPPMVTIAAKEGASSVTEGTAAEFTLTRGPPTAAEMTVKVTVTQRGAVIQTANSYQPPEEVTFTAGDARATLTVLTDDDEQQEEDGAVIATLQPGEEYRLGESSTQSARVTVRDNEVAPPPPPPPPPVLTGATVNGSTLVLTYDEALDGTSVPAAGAFVVTAAGSPITVNQVGVAGSTVTLTLASAVAHGEAVRVSYSPGTNPIQDAVGNDARGLSNQAVTNTTGAPNTAPEITTVGPFTVRENQALVGRLAARDDDSGDEVTGWSIMGGADQSQFSITSDTGDLSFQEAPDYESPTDVVSGDPPSGAGDNEYVVTVEVRSGAGARELEAEQTFTVRVTDEREPPGIPEAPAFSGETAGNLTVHWSEPDNSGPPITDYDVRYREGSRGGFTDAQHMGPGLSLTLADLEPGTAYEVQVRATNDEGTSDWSDPGEGMTVTPLTVEMMGGTEPPVEGPFTVRFSFSEPVRGFTQAAIETAQDPACTDEQNNPVFCEPDIGRLETVDDRVFSTTVTPQTDRVAHNYTLTLTVSGGAVRSSVGNKLNEEAMLGGRVAPPGVTLPISEIGLRASGLDRAGRLNWNQPTNDGGSPIIRYEHRHAPVGEVWNDWENVGARATGVTVGNLVNGLEYVFEVRAVNALGKGPVETAAAIPVLRTGPPPPPPPGPLQTVPDAPRDLLAEATDEQVTLSWQAPENDGGSEITDYQYRIDQRGDWISIGSTDTTHTVAGLVNGTAYVFEVRAVTAAGSSAPSNRVEATPRAPVTVLVANFMNGNNGAFDSRVYLWNPSTSAGQVTARVFTLPLTTGIAQELTGPPLDLGTLEARSALNVKVAEDILIPLGIALPYTTDGGNLMLEFTIQAVDVRGVAQVFSSDFAFGTYPLQEIPSTSSGSPTVLVANFTNANNAALHSRVYLWNPSATDGHVTVRVFTLPNTGDSMRLLTVPLGILKAFSARNIRIAEDILGGFLGIALPYTDDGGNLMLEFTIEAPDVKGAAQVFSSDFAFGTYPLQEIPSTSSGSPTVLVANFTNGNNGALHSRVYLWNPSASAGEVTVRVFTLPQTGDSSLLGTLDLGSLQAESARNLKLAEDILAPLGIPTPYVTDGGNLTLEFTIQAADARGVAQVFSSDFAFGTYPMQEIPSTSSGNPAVLVANFMNGNDAALNSRVYLWNPSLSAGSVTVRVFTLPLTAGVAQELTTAPLDLGTLGAESARNLKLVEDILTPLGIPTPYVTDGGNLTLEFTIQAADVRGAAQVFSSSFAFGTVPLQIIR